MDRRSCQVYDDSDASEGTTPFYTCCQLMIAVEVNTLSGDCEHVPRMFTIWRKDNRAIFLFFQRKQKRLSGLVEALFGKVQFRLKPFKIQLAFIPNIKLFTKVQIDG